MKKIYEGKTKDVYGLENGNVLLKRKNRGRLKADSILLHILKIGDVVPRVRFDGVVFNVFPRGKISLFVAYHAVNKGFLSDAVAKLLGNPSFHVPYHH